MSAQQQSVSGTLFRGADGNLYFVPDSALESFRVFDSEQPRIENFLAGDGKGDDAAAKNVEAVYTTIPVNSPPADEAMAAEIQKPLIFVAYLQDND
ncbi:MAG: hypothetical protein WCF84_00765 [Anaerolineae bacterium]